jgi:hypothetical protein
MTDICQLNGIEIKMQNEAMVVEGVHGVTAIGEDLLFCFFFEQTFAEGEIFFGMFEFGEEQTDHPQTEGFADGVVAAGGDGVADVGVNPFGLGGDELGKLGNIVRAWWMGNG